MVQSSQELGALSELGSFARIADPTSPAAQRAGALTLGSRLGYGLATSAPTRGLNFLSANWPSEPVRVFHTGETACLSGLRSGPVNLCKSSAKGQLRASRFLLRSGLTGAAFSRPGITACV